VNVSGTITSVVTRWALLITDGAEANLLHHLRHLSHGRIVYAASGVDFESDVLHHPTAPPTLSAG
jgi:hypothetical protein